MKIENILLGLAVLLLAACTPSKLKLQVQAGDYDRENCIVSADISEMGKVVSTVSLYELIDGKEQPVDCQLDSDMRLYWVLGGKTPKGSDRTFIVKKTKEEKRRDMQMQTVDNGKALIVKNGNANVLQYNYATVYPPEGVNPLYQRSGFIHPAYSPKGNVLTTIQPKDHYHHYGIWNPWTRVEYEGKVYDLWNLADKQGTVRARDVSSIHNGDVFTGYAANLDHYIFSDEAEKVIMNEVWDVKAWNLSGGMMWDFVSELNPSTDVPVTIKAYRYAGFGWRATEEWTKENSEMFSSEGKTRQEIDGTDARWIYVTGLCGEGGRSGFLVLGYPENYSAPEPLRIWDENANGGRGDAFVNFAPTKNKDWELSPGKKYKLRYRILTYDGEMTKERADGLWNDYAFPPKIEVLK